MSGYTKTAFTQGPLFVHDYSDDPSIGTVPFNAVDICINCDQPAEITVATMDKGMTATKEEALANAHLFSAAPDMYQIVKDLLEELRLIRMKDTNAVYDPTVRVRAEVVLAIAEGREEEK